jgi:hypothetical protein
MLSEIFRNYSGVPNYKHPAYNLSFTIISGITQINGVLGILSETKDLPDELPA